MFVNLGDLSGKSPEEAIVEIENYIRTNQEMLVEEIIMMHIVANINMFSMK